MKFFKQLKTSAIFNITLDNHLPLVSPECRKRKPINHKNIEIAVNEGREAHETE